MNNKLFYASILLLSSFMLAPNSAHAKIYKCVNTKGAVFYNDKPCPKKNKETELKAVKDPKSRYIPKPYLETKKDIKRAKGVIIGNAPEKNEDQKKELKDSNNLDLKNKTDMAKTAVNAKHKSLTNNDMVKKIENDNLQKLKNYETKGYIPSVEEDNLIVH